MFFRALSTAVRKLRRGRRDFDLDQLEEDVKQAFDDYPREKLESMWAVKSSNMKKIIEAKGGNDYNQHRTAEERQEQEQKQPWSKKAKQ